jgi:hypothetical protein
MARPVQIHAFSSLQKGTIIRRREEKADNYEENDYSTLRER